MEQLFSIDFSLSLRKMYLYIDNLYVQLMLIHNYMA